MKAPWTRKNSDAHRHQATRFLTCVKKQSLQTVCNFRAQDAPHKPQSPARPTWVGAAACRPACRRPMYCARQRHEDRHKGTMAEPEPGLWQREPVAANPVTLASARQLGSGMQTQPKSWSIMLDFAGITPSAILVKKWRGNRCSRLSGPIFPRTLCQHRYIWKLNDYHPRQRKRAL